MGYEKLAGKVEIKVEENCVTSHSGRLSKWPIRSKHNLQEISDLIQHFTSSWNSHAQQIIFSTRLDNLEAMKKI